MYRERRDVVVKGLTVMGLELENPRASFYVWASVPKGVENSKGWCFIGAEARRRKCEADC